MSESGLDESHLIENLQKIANRISTGIIVAALIMSSAMLMRMGGPHAFSVTPRWPHCCS